MAVSLPLFYLVLLDPVARLYRFPYPTMMTQGGDESRRPAKRARSEAHQSVEPAYTTKDADIWFDDGNIILVSAGSTGYRVHRSLLARNSEFFPGYAAVGASLECAGEQGDT